MSFAERLKAHIRARGPLSVADYMAWSNAHYYARRDPFGAAGDFTTAPEISQMFGELIGAWAADLWLRAGSPDAFDLIELGPGRGTLMADLLHGTRSIAGFHGAARVRFVEISEPLRRLQRQRVPQAKHHEDFASAPGGRPLILLANEFFDALPVEQLVRAGARWEERGVGLEEDELVFNEHGEVRERSPLGEEIIARIGARLSADGGAALIIDYGYLGGEQGDTLQAVKAHQYVDPLAFPGEADLTAHVDFAALARMVRGHSKARVHGPVSQATFLSALGIGMRAETLMKSAGEDERIAIADAVRRLVGPDEMGALFKVLAFTAPDWPPPAGFG